MADTDPRWRMGVRHVINLDLPRRDVFRQIKMAEHELGSGISRRDRLRLVQSYIQAYTRGDIGAVRSLGTILAGL